MEIKEINQQDLELMCVMECETQNYLLLVHQPGASG